jgi:hypothetical protein
MILLYRIRLLLLTLFRLGSVVVSKLFRWVFGRRGLAVLLIFLFLDLCLEWHGLPAKPLGLWRYGEHFGVLSDCRWVQVGLMRGLVLHEATVSVDTEAGPVLVRGRRISCDMSWLSLLTGRGWLPRDIELSETRVTLLDSKGRPGIQVQVERGELRREGDGSLRISLLGDCQGIRFDFVGTYTNVYEFLSSLPLSEGTSCRNPELSEQISSIGRWLRQQGRVSDESRIFLRSEGDCLDWKRISVRGGFTFSDWFWNEVVISKMRGRFSGSWAGINLERLDIVLSRSEVISGNGSLYPESREVEAELEGVLTPETLMQLGGVSLGDGLSSVVFPTLSFKGSLPRTELDLDKLNPSLSCELVSKLSWKGIVAPSGHFSATYSNGALHVPEFSLNLCDSARERIGGELTFNTKTKLLSGEIQGQADIISRLGEYGVRLPTEILEGYGRTSEFAFSLAPSPLDWRLLKSSGSFELSGLSVLSHDCRSLSITFSYSSGLVEIKPLSLTLRGQEQPVELSLSCDLASSVSKGEYEISYSAEFPGQAKPDTPWGTALSSTGKLVWRPENQILGIDCKGSCHPDWFYQTYCRDLELDLSYIFVPLGTNKSPVDFTLKLPEMSLGKDSWSLVGHVDARDTHFGKFRAKKASCDYSVDEQAVKVTNIKGETVDGDVVSLDIRVQYDPLEMSITNLVLTGNPAIATPFVMNAEAQDIYRQIWSSIQWGKRPVLRMPSMVYRDGPPWNLTLTGHLEAEDVTFRGFTGESLKVVVTLDLPTSVRVEPITLSTGGGDVVGDLVFSLGGVPRCSFNLDGTEGNLDPKALLCAVDESFADMIPGISFGQPTRLTMTGESFLSGDPRLTVKGTLKTPEIAWNQMKLTDVETNWNYSSNVISWDVKKSSLLGGSLRSTGKYELDVKSGECLAIMDGVPLQRVGELRANEDAAKASKANGSPSPALSGFLSGSCHAKFLLGWAGRPLNLEGDAHIALRKADLWSVPLLSGLVKLLDNATFGWLTGGAGKLGVISEVDADVEFHGDRLTVPNLYTNGTILALSGNGEYSWETDKLNFLVNGVPLKDVDVLSMVLRPLTWAFQAELIGTSKSYEWRQMTKITRMFSNE